MQLRQLGPAGVDVPALLETIEKEKGSRAIRRAAADAGCHGQVLFQVQRNAGKVSTACCMQRARSLNHKVVFASLKPIGHRP